MTNVEDQNLAIARQFIERFLGKGEMNLAEQLLSENV